MIDRLRRDHARLAGIAAAPLVVLLVSRVLGGAAGPSAARAAARPAPDTPEPALATPAATPEQIAAARFAAEALGRPLGAFPFLEQQRPAAEPVIAVPAPLDASGPAAPPLLVSAIMVTGSGEAVAIINGRMVRAGDALDSEWSVDTIDGSKRLVLVRHREGKQIELSIQEHRPKE